MDERSTPIDSPEEPVQFHSRPLGSVPKWRLESREASEAHTRSGTPKPKQGLLA